MPTTTQVDIPREPLPALRAERFALIEDYPLYCWFREPDMPEGEEQ